MNIAEWAEAIKASIRTVIYGKDEVIEKLLVALLCRGHVLLEDVPGVGKTVLASALSRSLGGRFGRIQCTPDLLPTDITGVTVYNPKDGKFSFKEGPIHSNIVLVDEINRANLSRVFGELMYLLEYRNESIPLAGGNRLKIPNNVRMIGTMNTADRSIALVDHALRRRFAFIALLRELKMNRVTGRAYGSVPVYPAIEGFVVNTPSSPLDPGQPRNRQARRPPWNLCRLAPTRL